MGGQVNGELGNDEPAMGHYVIKTFGGFKIAGRLKITVYLCNLGALKTLL